MAEFRDWTESQVLRVFEVLELTNPDTVGPRQPNAKPDNPTRPNPIYVTRLSDSSIPPPTGNSVDAKLENPPK